MSVVNLDKYSYIMLELQKMRPTVWIEAIHKLFELWLENTVLEHFGIEKEKYFINTNFNIKDCNDKDFRLNYLCISLKNNTKLDINLTFKVDNFSNGESIISVIYEIEHEPNRNSKIKQQYTHSYTIGDRVFKMLEESLNKKKPIEDSVQWLEKHLMTNYQIKALTFLHLYVKPNLNLIIGNAQK